MPETKIEIWNPLIENSKNDWMVCTGENKEMISRHLAQLLQSESLSALAGCGCSYQENEEGTAVGGPMMSDLWKLADEDIRNKIKTITLYEGENNIENFLSHCEAAISFIEDTDNKKMVNDFISDMRIKIQKRCSVFIDSSNAFDITTHVNFLRRVARRPTHKNRFMLFTTNYDLCFEKASSQAQFVIIDGFSFTIPRHFSPIYFSFDLIRKKGTSYEANLPVEALFHIYKLHGSVNWDDTEEGIIQSENPKKPCLIYPASSKYQSSYKQPYLEMMSHYLQAVRQPSQTLLVMGFGFADDHLFSPIQSALRSNNEFRMVVIDPCLKTNIEQDKGNYKELKAWRDSLDPRLTLINCTFEQFVDIVPEIYKPSAEERLFEIVKKIAKPNVSGEDNVG
jgi:hypothetical protein